MAIECSIIMAIFIIMALVFFRKKRKVWGLATLPLTLVPLMEVLFELILPKAFSLDVGPFVRMIALVVAVIISCVWIGCVSMSMKSKKLRVTYIGITNVFNLILAIILIYYILIEVGYWQA